MTRPPLRRVVVAWLAAALLAAGCSGGATTAPILPNGSPTAAPATAAPATGAPASAAPTGASGQSSGGIPAGCPTSAPAPMAADATATVTLATEKGNIVIKVEGKLGPNAAGNFVALVACGAYDGVAFHRIMPGFVLQGGDVQYARVPIADPTRMGFGGPGYTILDDPVSATYGRGTVAMARTSEPNSEGSQFFIVLDDAARQSLESANTYAIFGAVTSGMEVADAIAAGPSTGGQESRALQPVAITKATVKTP